MRILLTRPEPDSLRSAARLRARGHDVILAPLMRAETIDTDFHGPFAAVLMTSANAARAFLEHPRFAELRTLPVCAVGDHSAEVARAAGFAEVVSAQGAFDDLVRLVAPDSRMRGCSIWPVKTAPATLRRNSRRTGHGRDRRDLPGSRRDRAAPEAAQALGADPARRRAALFAPQRRDLAAARHRGGCR